MKTKLSMSRDLIGSWNDATGSEEADKPLERSVEASV
jgi:hypothetical protein